MSHNTEASDSSSNSPPSPGTQTAVGRSAILSFDDALKNAFAQLKVPNQQPSGHSDYARMKIEIESINVQIGGFTGEPSNFTVTIIATQLPH